MVKTTTFNRVEHPEIVIYDSVSEEFRTVCEFTYEDYKNRLS